MLSFSRPALEQIYPAGSYERQPDSSWTIKQSGHEIPWISIDPALPVNLDDYPRFKHAQVLTVTLQRGDVLYLPALWYHRVSQTASSDPKCPLAVAINVSTILPTST